MASYNRILVIPTIREKCLREFLRAWKNQGDWDHIIVVEDHPTKEFEIQDCSWSVSHYSWHEIEECLGEKSWIISRKDSAIRSFGFLKAWEYGCLYIVTLDDDCYPEGDYSGFMTEHVSRIDKHSRWEETIPGVRTRGLPYRNRGINYRTVANMGLWRHVPDYDSIQTLSGAKQDIVLPSGSRLIPRHQYFPMCGMNLCFRNNVAPLMYFPLMGENSPYSRFDDIWCGVIAKKIMDHLDYGFVVGEPFVKHMRASDAFVNLVKEAPGISRNEHFWEEINAIPLKGTNCIECMQEVGLSLLQHTDDYMKKLGQAILIWAGLFNKTSS